MDMNLDFLMEFIGLLFAGLFFLAVIISLSWYVLLSVWMVLHLAIGTLMDPRPRWFALLR